MIVRFVERTRVRPGFRMPARLAPKGVVGSLLLLLVLAGNPLWAQVSPVNCLSGLEAHRQEMNAEFADSAQSPLDSADRAHFTTLDFFPPDLGFCIQARFLATPGEKSFMMKKTHNREAEYRRFGVVSFLFQGKEYSLSVYQNLSLSKKPGYQDYLFLPFTDATNGVSTYGGGRYLDLKIPPADSIVLDFNRAYNPYCAYSHRFSCPIPPSENDLPFEVRAGVKDFPAKGPDSR